MSDTKDWADLEERIQDCMFIYGSLSAFRKEKDKKIRIKALAAEIRSTLTQALAQRDEEIVKELQNPFWKGEFEAIDKGHRNAVDIYKMLLSHLQKGKIGGE